MNRRKEKRKNNATVQNDLHTYLVWHKKSKRTIGEFRKCGIYSKREKAISPDKVPLKIEING